MLRLGRSNSIWTNVSALKYSKLLEDMATRGIKYVDCYGVDNALVSLSSLFAFNGEMVDFLLLKLISDSCIYMLIKQVRVADPTFLGYFIDKGVSAAAKVVRKVCNFFLIIIWCLFNFIFLNPTFYT